MLIGQMSKRKRTFSLQLRNLSPRSLHNIPGCTVQPEGSATPNIKGANLDLARTRKDPAEEEELPLQVAPISYPKVTDHPAPKRHEKHS
jgi:hypothetical protein